MDYKKFIDKLNIKSDHYQFYQNVIDYQKNHFIPAVKFDTALFLYQTIQAFRPSNILEIGFGSGVSSLMMNRGYQEYQNFDTLERDKNRYHRGRSLIHEFNLNINLIHEDAFHFLKNSKCQLNYDFIFLDSVKRDYISLLPLIKNKMNPGAVLITDNIFYSGMIIQSEPENKYKNGIELLKKFIDQLINDPDFINAFYNIGDGLAYSILRKK